MVQTKLRMLIPIYNNFNILDVGGPLDVFRNYALRSESLQFEAIITGPTKSTMAYEGAAMTAHYTFEEVIPMIERDEFNMLLVPGCGGSDTPERALKDTIIKKVMDTFIATNPHNKPNKWVISICTGALVLQATNIFDYHTVTTHYGAIESLQKECPEAKVVRQRWVDAGRVKGSSGKELRLVTSGGISCGLDCALFVVAEVFGDVSKALNTATTMDYNWNIDWKASGIIPPDTTAAMVYYPPRP